MKRTKTTEFPPEPLLEAPPSGPSSNRRKRLVWIFGGAVVLIAFLAWILGRSGPGPNGPEALSQGEDSPDAVIEKLHLVSTVQGQKRWEMFATKARLYQSQKQAYADEVYCQYYKADRIVSTLTAEKAVVNTETNATEAEGHVELVVENGSKLETEHLNWDPDTDEIKTESRVHIYKGMDDISAIGLTADTQLNNIRFLKDVHTQVRDTREIESYSKPKRF